MKFSKHYYDESTVYHQSGRGDSKTKGTMGRNVIKPIEVELPSEVDASSRLYTIYNDDGAMGVQTIVFDKDGKTPIGIIIGNTKNPASMGLDTTDKGGDFLLKKMNTPYNKTGMSYGGEVRINPPFKGYSEHPIDNGTEYFTDFSPETEYDAGETVQDSPRLRTV